MIESSLIFDWGYSVKVTNFKTLQDNIFLIVSGVKGSILGIGQEYLIGIIKYENVFAVNFNFSSLCKMKMKVFSLTH